MNFLDNIPEHIKLLKMLSDKKAIIGCRGQFSYNVLKKIGFKKVFIIGCPSFYKNGLNLKITKKEANKDLLVDVTFEWMKNREIWYNIIKFIPNFHVICQSAPETALFNLSLNKETSDDIKLLENLFNIKQNNIIKDKPIFKNRVSLFFDIEKWEDFINHRDFYIGPKIHGCLMHILNGKPGFLIVHDSRTREFAELFGIPHISSFEISSTLDIYEIYNTYSPKKLEKKYNNLFYNYLCFLDMCNLKYNFSNFTTKNKITLLIYKLKFYINNFFMPKLSLYCNTIIRKKISNNKKIIKFFGVEFFKQKKQNFKIYNYFLGIKFYTSFDLQGYIDNRITSLSNEILIIKDKINQLEKHKNMK